MYLNMKEPLGARRIHMILQEVDGEWKITLAAEAEEHPGLSQPVRPGIKYGTGSDLSKSPLALYPPRTRPLQSR